MHTRWDGLIETSGSSGSGTTYFIVTFNTDGGNAVASQKVAYNGMVTKPVDPVKDGYTFTGWYPDAELAGEYDYDSAVKSNFTAKEAIETYFSAGIINGKENDTVDPKGTATRAEVAAMLHRFLSVANRTGQS